MGGISPPPASGTSFPPYWLLYDGVAQKIVGQSGGIAVVYNAAGQYEVTLPAAWSGTSLMVCTVDPSFAGIFAEVAANFQSPGPPFFTNPFALAVWHVTGGLVDGRVQVWAF